MTAQDVAEAQEESDEECQKCGRELHAVGLSFCEGCCSHENTEERALLGDKCHDCGTQVMDNE